MGRVRLQIKKIENPTKRQVMFTKRGNRLAKKAYELSILCDVDVALIMFSPSGKPSIFAGSRSIEEIITRFIDLPEHERGRIQNQEYFKRASGRIKHEAQNFYVQNEARKNLANGDAQVEEVQQELLHCKSRMMEMEELRQGLLLHCKSYMMEIKQLQQELLRCRSYIMEMEKQQRVFEVDPSEISTVFEAQYWEKILEENLKNVHIRKQVLEKYNSLEMALNPISIDSNIFMGNSSSMVTGSSSNIFDWLLPREPQVLAMNFMNFNGFLPTRQQEPTYHDNMMELDNIQESLPMTDMNLSPWVQFYTPGDEQISRAEHSEWAFNETFMHPFSQ